MGTHHRLVVTGSHHDTHLVSQSRTLRVILIESCCPHGRPEVVCLQAQQQLKDMLVSFGIDTTKTIRTPCTKRRPLVVDKDSTIFHLRRRLDKTSGIIIQFILMLHWCIGHPVPGRHADTLGEIVNAIDSAALITASYNEVALHHVNQVGFPLTTYLLHIHLLLLDQTVDDTALAYGTYKD